MTREEQSAMLEHIAVLEAQLNQAQEQLRLTQEQLAAAHRDIATRKLAPRLPWSEMHASEHIVQFYETDDFLLDSVSGFIGAGLAAGDACIVIATKAHRQELAERLEANGLDLSSARARGKYLVLDAAETLSQFMVDGWPEPGRVAQLAQSLIEPGGRKDRRPVRIFGEMVALLWAEGNRAAAIRLEELWNELGKSLSFSLFCAYPMRGFGGQVYEEEFTEICQQHRRVLPAESYTQLSSLDERLRAITLLQQKAHSLEVELAERKAAEERLRVSESRYRRLFDSNLIGVFVADFAGTLLEANDALLDVLGYTREELLAGTMQRDALIPPEWRARGHKAVKALQETGASGTYETEYLHKSGKRIPVLVAVARIEQTETCIGFVLDISEGKELEQCKDAFITTASHELRTPLTIVQGYLELLGEVDDLRPELRHSFLSKARSACDELVLLLANMMDASRIEFDRIDLHCAHLPLKEVCTALLALFEPLILLEQRQVVVDIADRLTVWADEMRLKQILRNLIANALRYSPPRTPICITATLEQGNRMVHISVIDRGQGIPADKQRVIFDKFVRLERDLNSIVRGSGLGLYISRQLVEAMQGTITMTSSGVNGEGSTFSFTLPTSDQAKPAASSPISSTEQ